MADTKITAMTELTLPDPSADEVEIVDSSAGANKRIKVKNLHPIKAAAYMNSANNTTNAGWQKVPLDTTSFDTATVWDGTNKRFIPTAAGYYQFNGRVRTDTSGGVISSCYKNGSLWRVLGPDATSNGSGGSCLVYCNGTTDYLELWIYATSVRALTTGAVDNWADILGPF